MERRFLPTYKGCRQCGIKEVNPHAMGVRWHTDGKAVETEYMVEPENQGYPGIIHGGITAGLLDETIGWGVTVGIKRYVVTGELTIRYLRPIPLGTKILIRGRLDEVHKRYATGSGEIVGEDGKTYAKGNGKYFLIPEEEEKKVREILDFQPGDFEI